MIQYVFILLMIGLAGVGLFCSKKLDAKHPFWVRMVVFSQAGAALFTLGYIAQTDYVAFLPDLMLAGAGFANYALISSRFTARPWLDLRV